MFGNFKTLLIAGIIVMSTLLVGSSIVAAEDPIDKYGLDTTAGAAGITPTDATLPTILGNIINAVFILTGVIFFAMIVYAGNLWLIAGGNEEKIGKAKGLLINSVIGVMVIFLAYSLVYFVLYLLQAGTGDTTSF
jgi:hypothetical protein